MLKLQETWSDFHSLAYISGVHEQVEQDLGQFHLRAVPRALDRSLRRRV